MNKKIALYIGFVILTVLSRVVEHPANFTAVMALALFLGARLENKTLGLVLTLIPMVRSMTYSILMTLVTLVLPLLTRLIISSYSLVQMVMLLKIPMLLNLVMFCFKAENSILLLRSLMGVI